MKYIIGTILFLFSVSSFAALHNQVDLEDIIWMQCANRAQISFYVAQEKKYGDSALENLKSDMKSRSTEEQYSKFTEIIGLIKDWVGEQDFDTAKDYAYAMLYGCTSTNYKHHSLNPTSKAKIYMKRFDSIMKRVPETPQGMERL